MKIATYLLRLDDERMQLIREYAVTHRMKIKDFLLNVINEAIDEIILKKEEK